MTCNNFAVKRTGLCCTLELYGSSSLPFEESLEWTQRKEFGIQSGGIISRVIKRAGKLRTKTKWIQRLVKEVEPEDELEHSTNEKFAKALRLLPTNELPLSFKVDRPYRTMSAKKRASKKTATKKIAQHAEEERKRKEKCADAYQKAKELMRKGQSGKVTKEGWRALLLH